MDKSFKALGHNVNIKQSFEQGIDEKTKAKKGLEILKDYKAGKAALEQKIIE